MNKHFPSSCCVHKRWDIHRHAIEWCTPSSLNCHLRANVCECDCAAVDVTSKLRDTVIPVQNLLILPGWNGCCQDNAAPYLSCLSCVVLPLLISLKSIIDGVLSIARFLSLFWIFQTEPDYILASNCASKSSKSMRRSFKFILMQLKGYKTCLCVHPLHQRAESSLEITLSSCKAA